MDDAREAYWHEAEPRIIASGRWEQDEFGDTTYIPDHVRPSTAEAAEAGGPPVGGDAGPEAPDDITGDGYRIRSERTWAAARRDYLAGDSAEAVCARYDLKLGTLRHRAAREGWCRSDIPDSEIWPEPLDLDAETGPPDLADMARHALARLDRAVRRGRAAEAASWLRTWRALSDPALLAALSPDSGPEPEPGPDPLDALERDLDAVAAVARDAAALAEGDHVGRAAVEARLAALTARIAPEGEGPGSDDSDHSDGVFLAEAAPPVPSPLAGEGGP